MNKKVLTNMSVQEACGCSADEILVYPCAGGSNVGQLSNAAGVELTQNHLGRLFCLAAIGGHIAPKTEAARSATRVVAIDGCADFCSRKTLEHAGFDVTDHVVVTDLGIKKDKDLVVNHEDVQRVSSAVADSLGAK